MMSEPTTMQISIHNLELIRHALSVEIRLVDSYINKSQEQLAHLEELRDLWFDVDALLERQKFEIENTKD